MTPGEEIEAWLHGLERGLENIIEHVAGPVEAAQLRERRGIYEGIAADIKRKWPRLFVKCAGQAPSAAPKGDE